MSLECALGIVSAVSLLADAERTWRRFVHQRLNSSRHIRLLRILPDKQATDSISIVLDQFSLDSTPSYTALSYVWGSAEQPCTISCNEDRLNVTENLLQALRHLRQSNTLIEERLLWVDAICINQTDEREKSSQIQLMREIYTNAESVICWLGEEQAPLKHYRNLLPSPRTSLSKHDELLSLLLRPYWQRAWTFQEVLLSTRRSVNFGHTELEWDSFWSEAIPTEAELACSAHRPRLRQALQFHALTSNSNAINFFLRDPAVAKTNPSLLANAWQEFRQLTTFAKELQVSDTRDMIYSWMGMASTLGIEMPAPDYMKSTDTIAYEAMVAALGSYTRSNQKSIWQPQRSPKSFLYRMALPNRGLLHSGWISASMSHMLTSIPAASEHLEPSESDFELESDDDILCENTNFQIDHRDALTDLINRLKRELLYYLLRQTQSNQRDAFVSARFPEGLISCQHGSGGNESGTTSKDSGCQKKQKTDASTATASKGINSSNNDKDDNNENDDLEDRPRKQPKNLDRESDGPKYACPYFQRNPQSPHLHRACRGPGFPDMHRLKWHLYRVHYIHQCERCGQVFESESLLSSHRLAPASTICELTAWTMAFDRDQGFSEAQKNRLKRVKSQNFWNGIFSVLFPEDHESSYPPQYHVDTQFMQFSHQFQEFWNERSRDIVLQRLEQTSLLTDLGGQQDQNTRDSLVQMINEISVDVIHSFQHHVASEQLRITTATMSQPVVTQVAIDPVVRDNQAHLVDTQGSFAFSPTFPVPAPHPSLSLAELFNDIAHDLGNDMTWPQADNDFSDFDRQLLSLGGHQGTHFDVSAAPSQFPNQQNDSDHEPEGDWDIVPRV